MAEPGFETRLSDSRVHTVNHYLLLLLLKKEMEQAEQEMAGRAFQTEGTASTKALRQEQTGTGNRAILENSFGE